MAAPSMESVREESQSLRRCIRELTALSALAAVWSGSRPRDIGEGLARVLLGMLPADLIFLRIKGRSEEESIEIVRAANGSLSDHESLQIKRAISGLGSPSPGDPPCRMRHPLKDGTLYVTFFPIGFDAGFGEIAVGSSQAEFPDATDRVLLGVAANQAAVILQREASEETLRRRERELADFFDNATLGLHWVGPDGSILRANRAELEMLGYPEGEYVGRNIAEFHADPEVIADILQRLHSGEDLCDYEARLRCKDGSIKHVLISSNVLREDGEFIHTRCFTRDITNQKRAEEALRKSEEQYRRLVSLLPVAVYTCAAPSCEITFYNGHAAELWGRTPKIGDSEDRFCGSFKLWRPDGSHLPHEQTPMAVALSEGVAFRNQEVVIERPDGTRITVLVNIDPIRDENGRLVGAVNVFHDTTALKVAEQALRESERRFREMIDALPAAVYTTDAEGRVTHFNQACVELSGRVPELGSDQWCVSFKLFDPDGKPMRHEECPMAQSIRENRPVRGEEIIVERPDGERLWCQPYPTPLRNAAGHVVGGINMLVDITARKQAEISNRFLAEASATLAELADIETTLARVADLAVPDFADWCALDVLDASGTLRRLAVAHCDPEKVRLARELQQRYPPDENEPRGVMRVLRTGQTDWEAEISDELLSTAARDEEHLRLIRQLGLKSYMCVPFRSGGKTLGVITFVTAESRKTFSAPDVRLAEALADRAAVALENARLYERLELLWASASVLLAAKKPDAMLQELFSRIKQPLGLDAYFNYMVQPSGDALRLESSAGISESEARAIARLSFGQAICGTVALHREAIVVSDLQHSQDPRADAAKSFGLRAYACHPLQASGQLFGTLSFGSRTKDKFDASDTAFLETICHYVSVAYERLRLLEKLQQADRRKDEFLATLAHELRNPLAPVRNAVQVLRLKGPDQPELNWSRDVIERQVSHLTRLIDDLLDVSRITRDKIALQKSRVDLTEVIRGAVETSRPLIEQLEHELVVSLPKEPVFLRADVVRLAQVFMNLLTNAAKYTERGGRIWLTAERDGPLVTVRVRDTGVGIPEEKLSQLFEMFFQVDRSLDRAQGGLGIGLSLAKRLVEMHDGTIRAHSAGPGKGSEFVVTLPVLIEPGPDDPGDAPPKTADRPASRRILIADDIRDSADTLAMLLELCGNQVEVAYDGLAALEVVERFRPEMAILDIGMPKLNGYETCRRIKEHPLGKDVVVVALTGWGQDSDRRSSQEAGFDRHLTKPVSLDALMELLSDVGRA